MTPMPTGRSMPPSARRASTTSLWPRQMPIEPGATYVFDLGYYDYAWWAKLDAAGCRIVTRFKSNTPLDGRRGTAGCRRTALSSPTASAICHAPGQEPSKPVPGPGAGGPGQDRHRKGVAHSLQRLDASAQEIADLYKRRWAIELFFRWVKQTLKITRFLGTSENAVRIQIAVALIAFLLLRLAQAAQKSIQRPSSSPGWSAPTSCTDVQSTAC